MGGPVAECGGEVGFCEGVFAVSARKLVGIVVWVEAPREKT